MTLSPIDCTNEGDVCKLSESAYYLKDFWIMTDGYIVSICRQNQGEPASQSVDIPKEKFDALIQWYLKKQECRKPEQEKAQKV